MLGVRTESEVPAIFGIVTVLAAIGFGVRRRMSRLRLLGTDNLAVLLEICRLTQRGESTC